MMRPPEQALLYHFTHVNNLASIFGSGRLVADGAAAVAGLTTDVGDAGVKAARRRRLVPITPGGVVADYVPFYLAPRSPMMFRIACDHRDGVVGRYPDGDDPLVYLVTSMDRLVASGLQWAATDGNAAASVTQFTSKPEDLVTMIDWPLMHAAYWNDTPDDLDRQRRRMAEVLVHQSCPTSLLHGCAVRTVEWERPVAEILSAHGISHLYLGQAHLVLRLRATEVTSVIEVGTGNLLTADVAALVNTVNTVGVMGKGIALQFKRAFPANYAAYRAACERGDVRLGKMFVFDTDRLGSPRYVINFPTKEHWRSRSTLADIHTGLADLVRVVGELDISSVAVPALGCGNGGLDWSAVRTMIEKAFTELPEVRVLLFAPAGAPDPATMPVATTRPPLTLNRATLLVALHHYLTQARSLEARDGVSELEIQKIAYLLQMLGQPSRLAFSRGRYGPYAEQLHHVLQQLEGHYLVGYGDRSARVTDLQPIQLTERAIEEASQWLAEDGSGTSDRIAALMALVQGFETPYSLELLATVHYAAHQQSAVAGASEIAERVASWNLRKARLFTPRHISIAVDRLKDHDLLPR